MRDHSGSGRRRRLMESGLAILFLMFVLGVVRFMRSGDFGLYEDDWTIVPRVMGMSPDEFFRLLTTDLLRLYPHGRPLSNSLIYTFTFVGQGGGLAGLYLAGFLLVSANVAAFYLLVRRLAGQGHALMAGLAYVLFSADTTQAFLTHAYALHPSLFFTLIGLHAYLSGRRAITYVLGGLVLLTYEAPYFLLFAAPLLVLPWQRRTLKGVALNALVLLCLLAAIFALRSLRGDARLSGLAASELLTVPLSHMVVGPPVALATYIYRPMQVFEETDVEVLAVAGLSSLAYFFIFSRLATDGWREARTGLLSLIRGRMGAALAVVNPGDHADPGAAPGARGLWLVLVGLVMLPLAYPMTFTIRAYAISGRDTRVHFAAVVGSALLFGALAWLALAWGCASGRRRPVAVLLAVVFGLLSGYGVVVQRDYRQAWDYQRDFWIQLLPLVPDLQNGDAILVESGGLRDTRQIAANHWNLPRVLDQLVRFPETWTTPPSVYRLTDKWEDGVLPGGSIRLDGSTTVAPPLYYRTVPCQSVILIEIREGRLGRLGGVGAVDDSPGCFRPLGEGEPVWETTWVYDLLVEE